MSAVQTRLVRLLFAYDWEIVEMEGALFKILWGTWLLLPFQAFRTVQGYAQIGGEVPWGIALLVLGVAHFFVIYHNKLYWRRWITFVACLFWIFITVFIGVQIPTAAILPFFGLIAFFMAVNFMRIGILVKAEKRLQDLGRPEGKPERRHDNA